MNLSVSNIAWDSEQDVQVYELMKKYGFDGLEIAPTRIFPDSPYDKMEEASSWSSQLKKEYGFAVPSMQSIWFGRQEMLFGSEDERKSLVQYTKLAIEFAESIGCKNLVFGCPRNRNMPQEVDSKVGRDFFKEIGDYATEHGTVIGMEANPPIYNTNYINDTLSAFELITQVDSAGFLLNLDVGTMIQNGELVDELVGKVKLIHHVHISEPGLKPIEERKFHIDLKKILEAENYQGFISIEMGKAEDIHLLEEKMSYVRSIFG